MNTHRTHSVQDWGPPGAIGELRTLLVGMGLYLGAFMVMRLLLATAFTWDDAEQAVFAQHLAWGYDPRQPPLYTWLLWAVQRVVGPTAAAGIVLSYSLLLCTMAFFFLSSRRILQDARLAGMATLGVLSMFQIGWRMHEMFTHTALLVTCCAAGLWAFLRIVDRGGLQDYLLFGTILGLGGLAKYSFLVFLGCLFAAAAMQPILRQRLWRPGMLLSIGTGLVIVGPYLLWFLREGWDLSGTYRQLMFPPGTGGWTARALAALRTLPKSIVAFSSPLLPVSALLFPAAFHPRLPPDPPPATSGGPDLVRLVRDMLLVAVSLLSLGALAGAVDRYRERWMHPFLLVVPIYLVARIRRARPSRRQVRLFIAALLLFPLVALGFRGGQLILGPLLCGWPCRDRTPFDQLAARLAEAGFRGGTIVAPDMYTGANLRAHFPRSRVIALGHPFFDPPPSVAPGQCLIVWTLDARGLHPPPKALEYAGLAGDGAHPREPVRRASIPWRLRFAGDRDLITTWAYLLIPEGAGRCS